MSVAVAQRCQLPRDKWRDDPARAWGIARFRLIMLWNPRRCHGSAFFRLADVMLGVELETEAGHQLELGFEVIDVLFLVVHELFEQVPRHIILCALALSRRLL